MMEIRVINEHNGEQIACLTQPFIPAVGTTLSLKDGDYWITHVRSEGDRYVVNVKDTASTTYTVYICGMTLGVLQDQRFKGEATALLNALVNSFIGSVERSFPFKDRDHECVSLMPTGQPMREFDEYLKTAQNRGR